jgi:hypothetical protein
MSLFHKVARHIGLGVHLSDLVLTTSAVNLFPNKAYFEILGVSHPYRLHREAVNSCYNLFLGLLASAEKEWVL